MINKIVNAIITKPSPPTVKLETNYWMKFAVLLVGVVNIVDQ